MNQTKSRLRQGFGVASKPFLREGAKVKSQRLLIPQGGTAAQMMEHFARY